jgi:hypothetical protein
VLVDGEEGLYHGEMMVGKYGSILVLVVLGSSLFGCSGDDFREQCESMCEFVSACSDMACPDNGVDNCVQNLENASDSCQDAVEEFTECWDEHPQCESVSAACLGSTLEFSSECGDDFGV